MPFKANLKNYRKKCGLSQEELDDKLNRSQSTIVMWNSGRRKPRLSNLYEIAKVLKIDICELIKYYRSIKENKQ